jgi:hypothetical protein
VSRHARALVVLLIGAALAAACRQETNRERILKGVDRLARLAEKKDIEAIMTSVADDYLDFEGRDKTGLRDLLSAYLTGRVGIVVHRLGGQVEFREAGRGELQMDVALSSGAAEALRRLVRISPDLYRVKIEFVRSADQWLIQWGEWESIGVTEALPESLGPLKKLFLTR